jgi:hypothetical protein
MLSIKYLVESLNIFEKKETTINGIFILNIPRSKIKDTPSRIVVELNPSDEFGNL